METLNAIAVDLNKKKFTANSDNYRKATEARINLLLKK